MLSPDQTWIAVLGDVVTEAMRRFGCSLNSCVEAGCIGVGVAAAFGYAVEPIPVAVQVTNGREATVLPALSGMRVGQRRRDGFEGHLVLYFPGISTMVDLTARQFHAPSRGLLVPGPLVGQVDRGELAGDGVVADLGTGTVIHYREMVDNVAWRALPAWRESSAMSITVIVRQMRERLAVRSRVSARRAGTLR